jgi:hypothetical protein
MAARALLRLLPGDAGGGVADENQVGVCLAHHRHGIHEGYVRVSGRAPDALAWELGEA